MTPCGCGSCATIVIAPAGTVARPKPHSIDCAPPSPVYGSSIRPTSRNLHNDDGQAAAPGCLRPYGQEINPSPVREAGDATSEFLTVREESSGEAVSFSPGKDGKTAFSLISPQRAANKRGQSTSVFFGFPLGARSSLICCEIASRSNYPFRLSSSSSVKIRDDSCVRAIQ